MKPRRLRVKGYTAFVEEANIDFDGLDLFAITGPTGAGKTSLLQAMTIALYGRAPKLGDDLRQLISPVAERAHFFFEFRAHGRDYRITRVMFRNRPTTVALEARSADGEWQTLTRGVREANARVEQVLGLDFDSFTKVVLLPQNEFDAFLRGKPDERRSILTRLLSLEIYGRIQQRANQVAAEARTEVELLTGLLERDYADATAEHLAEITKARAAAEAAAQAATAQVEKLERAAAAALEARQRRGGHRTASEELAGHERTVAGAREEHKTAVETLSVAEAAVRASAERLASIAYDADRHLDLARAEERATRLRAVIAALIELEAEDARGQEAIRRMTERLEDAIRGAGDAQRVLAFAVDAQARARADLEEQQRRFGTRATIAGLMERQRRYREDRRQEKEGQEALDELISRESRLTEERDAARVQHAEAQERLRQALSTQGESERAVEAARALWLMATGLAEQLTEATERSARARRMLEGARGDTEDRRARSATAEGGRRTAEEAAGAAEQHVRHVERTHAAHTLRAVLVAGEPCPVCETSVARVPVIEPVEDLEQASRTLRAAREQLARAQETEQQAATALATAEEAVRAMTIALDEAQTRADRLAGDLRGVLPPELQDEPGWREALQSQLDEAIAQRAAGERAVEEARRDAAGIDAAMAEIRGELATLPARIEGQRESFVGIRQRCEETERVLATLLGRPPGPDAAIELTAIDARLLDMEATLTSTASEVQQAQDRRREAQLEGSDSERALAAERARAHARADDMAHRTREREEIVTALETVVPGQADVAAAIAAELTALDDARGRREQIGQELDAIRQERGRAERRVGEAMVRVTELERHRDTLRERERSTRAAMETALAELASRLTAADLFLTGDGDEHNELSEIARRVGHDREVAVRRSVELAGQERALAEKLSRAAECREQRDAARTRADVARELGQLLGANNLQTYVLADAMRVLVEDGSLYLQRLSDGRYRLQAEDLDFHVIDSWNGDAVRSVKTLSGGETFLTSLALALALAERLADLAAGAHGHEALESLFVDEGFGALDIEETLETVVQAIEALQAHDRLVGIVTHLTPLAERMPAQIKVRKAPEGSRIEIVS